MRQPNVFELANTWCRMKRYLDRKEMPPTRVRSQFSKWPERAISALYGEMSILPGSNRAKSVFIAEFFSCVLAVTIHMVREALGVSGVTVLTSAGMFEIVDVDDRRSILIAKSGEHVRVEDVIRLDTDRGAVLSAHAALRHYERRLVRLLMHDEAELERLITAQQYVLQSMTALSHHTRKFLNQWVARLREHYEPLARRVPGLPDPKSLQAELEAVINSMCRNIQNEATRDVLTMFKQYWEAYEAKYKGLQSRLTPKWTAQQCRLLTSEILTPRPGWDVPVYPIQDFLRIVDERLR